MGYWVKIVTITNSKERLAFEIKSDELYRINCYTHIIESPDLINQICIFNDIIVLLTEDRDFRNGAVCPVILER